MEGNFVYFQLILTILFGFAISQPEKYRPTYYMDENASTSKNIIDLNLSSRAVVIKASSHASYRPVKMTATCYVLAPKYYKLVVSVVSFNIPKDGRECNDYLEIEGLANHSDDEEMCGRKEELASVFYSNGNKLKITLKTAKRSGEQPENPRNFEVVVTALKQEHDCYAPGRFLCNNKQCVPYAYTCDGFNNCGDQSDEFKCKNGQMESGEEDPVLSTFQVTLIVFASIILSILLGSVIVYKCRKGGQRRQPNELSRIATVSGLERQISTSQSYTTPTSRPTSPQFVNQPPDNPYFDDRVFQPYQGGYGPNPEVAVPPPSYEEATLRK